MKIKLKIKPLLFIIFTISVSCHSGKEESIIIAKAGGSVLRTNDTKTWISNSLSEEDSAQLMHRKIKEWAKSELLAQEVRKIIVPDAYQKIEKKVADYRNELLISYLLKFNKDSIIDEKEVSKYYKKYKNNFKLNRNIVKLEYIRFYKSAIDNKNILRIERLFRSNRIGDRNKLSLEGLSKAADFKLKDSAWKYFSDYYAKLPFPKITNKAEFLKRVNFLRLHDSVSVYLVKILDYKLKNSPEPLVFSREKIKSMLNVQQNKNYIDKLKENLLDKAIKNKTFEIYEKK